MIRSGGSLRLSGEGIAWEENLADVCGLAYLRDLSGRKHLNEHQRIRQNSMLGDYIRRKLRFAFMKPLLERLGSPDPGG